MYIYTFIVYTVLYARYKYEVLRMYYFVHYREAPTCESKMWKLPRVFCDKHAYYYSTAVLPRAVHYIQYILLQDLCSTTLVSTEVHQSFGESLLSHVHPLLLLLYVCVLLADRPLLSVT